VTRAAVLAPAAALLVACGGAERPAGPDALVEDLRRGGHVIFLRHGLTDHSERDVLGAPMHDCARQRNLTEAGREQARQIGEAIRALGIPVGEVVSSEYCRCLETARLAFGRADPDPDLTGLPGPGREAEHERQVAALRVLLSAPPAPGTNRVVVGHGKSMAAAAGLEPDEGEAVVVAPLPGGGFEQAGRIPASVWPRLADALARS
jgi:phosphohistidine phosphatase SixA